MGEFAKDSNRLCAKDNRNVILVGKSGCGKSATVNSIIEADMFDKMPNSVWVTTPEPCYSVETVLDNGQILTLFDTGGDFDISCEPQFYNMEPGIHAVVLVLSLETQFSVEESTLVIESLMRFFGTKLSEYMIVVFTHGDAFEDTPLDHYLDNQGCPDQLKKILEMCGNRSVVFDNMTEDEFKKFHQREELLCLIDEVVANNWGLPYTEGGKVSQWEIMSDQHTEVEYSDICENGLKPNKAYEDQLLEMESKYREMTEQLEKQLADEQTARMKAEADAQSAQMNSNEVIGKLTEDLKRAQRETRKLRKTLRETNPLLMKQTQERDDENLKKNNCAYSSITLAIENQIESKVSWRLENQMAEKFGRMQEEQRKSNDEMRKLREDMERFQKYTEDTFKNTSFKMGDNYVHMERFQKYTDEEENQKKYNYPPTSRMPINLTEGAIAALSGDGAQNSDIKPVLQVADIRVVNSERYKILLSDGSFTQHGMLSTQRNHLVHTQKLQKGSIVHLTQFVCNIIQNRRFIIVIDLDVIVDKCEDIGDPQPFPVKTPSASVASSPTPFQPMNQQAGGGGGRPPSYSAGNRCASSAGSAITDSVPRPLSGGGIHVQPPREDLGRYNASKRMPINLTEGAIAALSGDGAQNSDIKPVLQVADIRVVNSERYKILLSDGSFTQHGMLAAQRNHLVHTQKLQKGSIVQLKQFVCNFIKNRRIIIIVDLDVIVDKYDRIGEPQPFPVKTDGNVSSAPVPAPAPSASVASSPTPFQPMNQQAGGGGGRPPSYSAGNRGASSAGSVITDSVPRPLSGGGIHVQPPREDLGRYNASNTSSMYSQALRKLSEFELDS